LEDLIIDESFSINQYLTDDISPERIVKLDMSNKNLTEIPPNIFILENLKELDLSCNQLVELNPIITKLKELKTIDIHKNQWENIPEILWSIPKLEEMIIDSCLLLSLPKRVSSPHRLTVKPIIKSDVMIRLILFGKYKYPLSNYNIIRLFDSCQITF